MDKSTDAKPSFVTIRPKTGAIEVSWGYSTFMRTEDDGRISCYIPGFEIFFGVKSKDDISRKGKIMTKMFFDHFFKHTKSIKTFALEMHKRGFKAANDAFTVKEFMNNRPINAKFKSVIDLAPDDFEGAEHENHVSEMEVAF